jgi:hypothetical protein
MAALDRVVNSRYREKDSPLVSSLINASTVRDHETRDGTAKLKQEGIGDIEVNLIAPTHLMKRRGRMMVLPGRDRVRTDAGVGAGKINGQDFAAARRRAYRV